MLFRNKFLMFPQQNNDRRHHNRQHARYDDDTSFGTVIGHQSVADGTLSGLPRHLCTAAEAAKNLQAHTFSSVPLVVICWPTMHTPTIYNYSCTLQYNQALKPGSA